MVFFIKVSLKMVTFLSKLDGNTFWVQKWQKNIAALSTGFETLDGDCILGKGFRLWALQLAFWAQGSRLWLLQPAFWAQGSDFGRASLHFEHRVQTLDSPSCILSKGFGLWTSLMHLEHNVQTLGAKNAYQNSNRKIIKFWADLSYCFLY